MLKFLFTRAAARVNQSITRVEPRVLNFGDHAVVQDFVVPDDGTRPEEFGEQLLLMQRGWSLVLEQGIFSGMTMVVRIQPGGRGPNEGGRAPRGWRPLMSVARNQTSLFESRGFDLDVRGSIFGLCPRKWKHGVTRAGAAVADCP